MGIFNRVMNSLMGWLVASAGRRARIAIEVSEINEMHLALKRASELIDGQGIEAALGKRLRHTVGEAAGYSWGDPTEETKLLVDFVAEHLIARPAPDGDGHDHAPAIANGNGHARPPVALPAGPRPGPLPDDTLFVIEDDPFEGLAILDEPVAEPETVPTPRKRGRPRKNAEPSPAGEGAPMQGSSSGGDGGETQAQAPASDPKRRRGRPRKHPLPPTP